MTLSTQGMAELSDMLLRFATANVGPAVAAALTDASQIVVDSLKRSAAANHHREGNLEEAIGVKRLEVYDSGGYALIDIMGGSVRGYPRRSIGFELNSGSYRRAASHWWDHGVENAQAEAEAALLASLMQSLGLDKSR